MHTFFLRIRTDRISLFRFLLEGYDGLAVLTTVDVQQGLVRLMVPKDRYEELWALLAAVCEELAPTEQALNTARQLPKNAKSPTMRHS
ncbi:MAG: DUF4911 domain-containing protein [Candidatus Electronema sp. V4]|uniref:DUF4911 domain-containing protein n=1 Tax=Candidatus Electronema sp. V4 TaxID=3454756 RepID=UPI0040558C1F